MEMRHDEHMYSVQAISRTVAWKWGGRLKAELAGWAKHEEGRHAACKVCYSLFPGVSCLFCVIVAPVLYVSHALQVLSTLGGSKTATPEGYFLSCFFNMLQQLNQRDMLPLLVFSFDRRVCEDLAGGSPSSPWSTRHFNKCHVCMQRATWEISSCRL